jgi:hypothetical protein
MDPVALGVKTPDTMSSLGQIMNVANASNQYQAGQIANQSNQQVLQERNNVRSLFSDPTSVLGDDGTIDFNKAAPKIMAAAPTQGGSILAGLYTAQNQSLQAKQQINSLSASQRDQLGQFVGSLGSLPPDKGLATFDAFIQANPNLSQAGAFAREHLLGPAVQAASDPSSPNANAWASATNQMRLSVMSPDSQRAALTPNGPGVSNGIQSAQINTNPMAVGANGQPLQMGAPVPGTTQTQFVPLGQQQTANADGTVTVKDASGNVTGVVRTPGLDVSKPPAVTASSMDISQPSQLPHKPRTAGQPYMPDPSEAVDLQAGQVLRTGLVNHLNNTAELNNNLNESFSAITKLDPGAWYTSGATGTMLRTLKNLVGSSDYQQLSKDLANVQLSQLQAQGGSMQTDAGKRLQDMASGSATYNPDVLLNIMKRTQAKQIELQMQAPGLQAFSQRYGDANYAKYVQDWSKNADSKVFQAIAIGQSGMSKPDQQRAINELLGSDAKVRQTFFTKYNNIKSLSQSGVLPAEAGQ